MVIKLPDVGEGVAEAELVEWHVKVGDLVREDAPLAAVMTDKATVEIPSPAEGEIVWLGRGRGRSRCGRLRSGPPESPGDAGEPASQRASMPAKAKAQAAAPQNWLIRAFPRPSRIRLRSGYFDRSKLARASLPGRRESAPAYDSAQSASRTRILSRALRCERWHGSPPRRRQAPGFAGRPAEGARGGRRPAPSYRQRTGGPYYA